MCSTRDAADRAHARFSAGRGELLEAVAELAATGAWRGDGAGDLASWMSARWQMSVHTARELVRDAEALRERPALGAALSAGSISIDQCKALTVLCEPDTDDDEVWLENLETWSISELERRARRKKAEELERRDDGVFFRMAHTPDERYMRGEFQLHPEDGAAVLSAVESRVAKDTPMREWDRASALALVELAKGPGAAGSDRPTVLLSVSEAALAAGGEVAALGSGGFVGSETARRLACDARTQVLYRDETGGIAATARTSAGVSPAMRRAVAERDGGRCTFPGCERDRFLECHHILHRSQGGQTVLTNLLLVCWTHHTLIHEGGWSLRGKAGPRITWVRPDGTPFEPRVRVVLDTS